MVCFLVGKFGFLLWVIQVWGKLLWFILLQKVLLIQVLLKQSAVMSGLNILRMELLVALPIALELLVALPIALKVMLRDFFVELWDVSGHERYKDCRSLFFSQINGVVFVHDLSQRRTKTSLRSWAVEIAANGTFSAPLGSGGPGGLQKKVQEAVAILLTLLDSG